MSIDAKPENTPLEVQRREAQKYALMMSSDAYAALPPDDDLSAEEKDAIKEQEKGIPQQPLFTTSTPLPRDPLTAFAELLKTYGEHREVRVHTPIGAIVLRALHVCVNKTSIGLVLSKDDIQIELTIGSELSIEIAGRPMTVIYGGGLFTFNKIPVIFLSFFRVSEDSDSADTEETN